MRVVLICKYDGTFYNGFQVQPDKPTIQEEIERSLKKIHKGEHVRIHMSGRTDSGVHAYSQPIHFDTNLNLSGESWKKAVNATLPKDIRIIGATIVNEDFHVRFDSVAKTYEYKLYLGEYVDPFLVNYVGHYPFSFDYNRAEECLEYFLGTHDFSSFCSKNSSVEDKVRTITNFTIKKEDNLVVFEITGDGFLYNMVRIIIGTIIEVANGKYDKEKIKEIIDKKNRVFAGKRADASGLYLKRVYYNNNVVDKLIEKLQ